MSYNYMLYGFSRIYFMSRVVLIVVMMFIFIGCSGDVPSHPLDPDIARNSVQTAMQAWEDGKTPKDLQPGIVVGDPSWTNGQKLVSFEVLANEETSDGSNLYIRVKQKLGSSEVKVTYVVGTSPIVTIFPQQ